MGVSSEVYALIAKKLGKKVIIMSTSTGGTLSLQLAAAFPEIAGLVMYSPNIEINNAALTDLKPNILSP
jgi:alpha-beta hydrolase superfamily lysophospholipase